MRPLFAALFALSLALSALVTAAPSPAAAANCDFVLGFKLLHDTIPAIVGESRTNEYHNPVNGDGLQETTAWHGNGGLLVWRKSDNWTAFTDGTNTWVNGPFGVQQRPNNLRFEWEGPDSPGCGIAVDASLQSAFDKQALGCPVAASRLAWAAWQPFEGGYMFWRFDTDRATVLFNGGQQRTLDERWTGQTYEVPLAPAGRVAPVRGFGWIWVTQYNIRQSLGWGIDEEKGFCALIQDYERGFVFQSTKADCSSEFNRANEPDFDPLYFRIAGGSWQRY